MIKVQVFQCGLATKKVQIDREQNTVEHTLLADVAKYPLFLVCTLTITVKFISMDPKPSDSDCKGYKKWGQPLFCQSTSGCKLTYQ